MPEIKISELTPASTPAGTEVLAIVQSDDTKQTTINSLASALAEQSPLEDNLSTGAPTWTTAGVLRAGHDIIAGYVDSGTNSDAGGTIGLTLNDGYGDANLTFNHTGGTPDRSGSSARISSSVDSNQELLDFQLKGSVNAGISTALTSVLKLYDDKIQLLKPTTLSTSGTGTTSLVNKGYIDTALSGKADTSHTHSQYSLNTHLHDDRYSQIGHGHSIGNISNLQTILNGKIGETEINTSHFTFSSNTLSLNTIQEGQIGTGAVTTSKIKDANVTKGKIEDVADYKVLGNVSGAAAAPAEVAILDEDYMTSNSATALATQQSIKAYVDSSTLTKTTGTAPYYGCRAFASYNGVTEVLNNGANIASVTRNSAANYTFNFVIDMPDVNYSIVVGGTFTGVYGSSWIAAFQTTSKTTSSFTISSSGGAPGGGDTDQIVVDVAVFR